MAKELNKIIKQYNDILDMDFINQILQNDKDLKDFEMNKTTLMNIGEWALNGSSDEEIRKKLDLSPKQWSVLLSICPTLILVMKDSRALADVIIAGSLFQTAIGGKVIKRQVAKSVTEYNEMGKPCGQHLEIVTLEEELPPNADLLKYLATHKLSEKFGGEKVDDSSRIKDVVSKLTPEQMAIIEAAREKLNGEEIK